MNRRRRRTHLIPRVEAMEYRLLLTADFGDAPDLSGSQSIGDYDTLLTNGGPSHALDVTQTTLFLGARVDADDGTLQNLQAHADDNEPGLLSDEDGVLSPLDLQGTEGASPTIAVQVTNQTGTAATLFGWIDYNKDGVFDNDSERTSILVPDATVGARLTLTFPEIPAGTHGTTYARLRLSTDMAAADPTGPAADGEVEDYRFRIASVSDGRFTQYASIARNMEWATAPFPRDSFGASIAAVGDLDADGVTDLAVGAPWDSTLGEERGAVHILFMNADGSVREASLIADSTGGGPELENRAFFGQSVAAVGDLNGDGITELAVGAPASGRGAVYLLFLQADGTASRVAKLGNGLGGLPQLADDKAFGSAVAGIGDLNGDGLPDLAVSDRAFHGAGPLSAGAVYVMNLTSDGTVSQTTMIAHEHNGGPSLVREDHFGSAVTGIGDLDGDGTPDLAVGQSGDDTVGLNSGAVQILFMNADGSVRAHQKIPGSTSLPPLPNFRTFGISLASPGDIDGDGVTDLVVGSYRSGASGYQGTVDVLWMQPDGTVRDSLRMTSGQNGVPALADYESFGRTLASIGDLNGDGRPDLAIGSYLDNNAGDGEQVGAFRLFSLNAPDRTPPAVTITPAGGWSREDLLRLTFQFSESVTDFTASDIQLSSEYQSTFVAVDEDTYTLEVTVNNDAAITVSVAQGAARDAVGNLSDAATATVTVDRTSPTVLITEPAPQTHQDTMTFDIAFSEPVTQFDADDLVLSNATLLTFTPVDAASYQIQIRPLADGELSVSIPAAAAVDPAGNDSVAAGLSTRSDRTPPALLAITRQSPVTPTTSRTTLSFLATFSEPVSVEPDDFAVTGTTAVVTSVVPDATSDGLYQITVAGGDLATLDDGFVGLNLSSPISLRDLAGNLLTSDPPATNDGFQIVRPVDYGDAPDTTSGTGPGNYQTTAAHGGPSHRGSVDLTLGGMPDADDGTAQNTAASADDDDGVLFLSDLTATTGTAPTIAVRVTNTTGAPATLAGWIDFNADGVFDSSSERATLVVPSGVSQGRVTLTFPAVPVGFVGTTYVRLRLSSDPAFAADPQATGAAANGEVEDYRFTIVSPAGNPFRIDQIRQLSNLTDGGPQLADGDFWGVSVTGMGDLDGDGTIDLAVGAPGDDTGGTDRGALHILLMNADGTIRSRIRIADTTNGGPALSDDAGFGSSVAGLGDLDGDGIPDLAVGALLAGNGADNPGAVYLLLMHADGTAREVVTLSDTEVASGPALERLSLFGAALATIDDESRAGVSSLLVGAPGAGVGREGVVYVLSDIAGSAQLRAIDVQSLSLATEDFFGVSVASLGDLNGDGVEDLVVGATGDDTGGTDRGAIYILMMHPDGTIRDFTKIAHETGGGPTLADEDWWGRSVANIGDLDGDGIVDLAVGATLDDDGGADRGAVYLLFLNADGTVKRSEKISSASGHGLALSDEDFFGEALFSPGDISGDGVPDLIVTAAGSDLGGTDRGSLYILNPAGVDPTAAAPVIQTLDQTTTANNRLTLTWDAVASADAYEVWYTYATNNTSPFLNATVVENAFTPPEQLPIGRYNIWVRVVQNEGTTSPWSQPIRLRVAVPVTLNTVQDAENAAEPTFTWAAIAGAAAYEVWGNNLTTGQTQIISDRTLVDTSFTPSAPLEFGLYRFWVRALDVSGAASAWSAPQNITRGPQPVKAVDANSSLRPTFIWTSSPGTASYELYLATPGGTLVHPGLTESTFTPEADLMAGPVRWWVRGYTDSGRPGPWSAPGILEVGGRTLLISPSVGVADTHPTFSWLPIDGATQYGLYIAAEDGRVVLRADNLTQTEYNSTVSFPAGTYRIWIRTTGAGLGPTGLWSRRFQFAVS